MAPVGWAGFCPNHPLGSKTARKKQGKEAEQHQPHQPLAMEAKVSGNEPGGASASWSRKGIFS